MARGRDDRRGFDIVSLGRDELRRAADAGEAGGREFELIRAGDALYLVRIRFIEGTPQDPKTDLSSEIFRWEDGRFELAAHFPTFGGTDATAFEADGAQYLAVSNSLTAGIRFRQDTIIYRFDG